MDCIERFGSLSYNIMIYSYLSVYKKIISLFNIISIFTKNEKKTQFIYYFMDSWG
jgi:hypothetical protein